MRRSLILPVFLAVAACSGLSREARIETKLEQAGIKPHLARCLAHKLDDSLSDDELARLSEAAKAARNADADGGRHLSIGRLADQLQSPDDRHLADVVSRAALGCAILG
jgi:hypothetical protein